MSTTTTEKRCTRCHEQKALTAFHRLSVAKDGHRSACRECVNAHVRAYLRTPKNSIRRDTLRRLAERRDATGAKRYNTAHVKLRRIRGAASSHSCVHCGNAAQEWSLVNDHSSVKRSARFSWSDDPMAYRPLCRPCHGAYDATYRREAAS